MKTTIAFIRHGEVHNPEKILYCRLPNFDLTEEGCHQAVAAKDLLNNYDRPVDYIFSSPMLRAQHTAKIIAENISVLESPLLNEVYSYYEGQPSAILQELNWDFYTGIPEKYEQPSDLVSRFKQFIQKIRQQYPGKFVVAVSHGDPIYYFNLWLIGEPLLSTNKSGSFQFWGDAKYPPHASITLVEYQSDNPLEKPTVTYQTP